MFSKKFILRYLWCFLLCVFCFSCKNSQSLEINYSILTPKYDWTYFSDSLITFSTNLNSDEIMWYSDKDGYLGNGNGFTVKLNPGYHDIKAIFRNNQKSVSIYVEESVITNGQTVTHIINSKRQSLLISKGLYSPSLVTLDGSINYVSIDTKPISDEVKKDIPINRKLNGKTIISKASREANINEYSLNDEKKFYVLDTRHQNYGPNELIAKVIRVSDSYVVWYPTETEEYTDIQLDENLLDLCIDEIENRIIPRIKSIWGELPDIDKDGKISFLFTPTINEEGIAIGFFNPEDFYRRDEDSPYSNEMDILYFAVPEQENFSYSVKCISATIAHELTHAINYNIKTYSRVLKNNNNPPVEETFLDEAMSHLSESLCGYGISGGNIGNLCYYLNNLERYSVHKTDLMGYIDSNGQRAAATMFLSWLFWKRGGIDWNKEDPLAIIDCGGIKFLKELVASDGVGWDNIGNIFGRKTDILYVQMVEELNATRAFAKPMLRDPYSGEPVQLYPDYQEYCIDGSESKWKLEIHELKPNSYVSLIPYSFVLFEKCINDEELVINNDHMKGQVLSIIYIN